MQTEYLRVTVHTFISYSGSCIKILKIAIIV